MKIQLPDGAIPIKKAKVTTDIKKVMAVLKEVTQDI